MDTPNRDTSPTDAPVSPALEHARALLERHVPTLTVVPCDTLESLHRTRDAALRYVQAAHDGDPDAMHDAFGELAASVGQGDDEPAHAPVMRALGNLREVTEALAKENAARRALRAWLAFAGLEGAYAAFGALFVAAVLRLTRGSVPAAYWAFPPLAVVAALLIPGKGRWREAGRTLLLLTLWALFAVALDLGSAS